jgi:hypothetical protein
MANDSQTLQSRRAARLGAVSTFQLPPFPRLPSAVISRFPDLLAYEQQVIRWVDNANTALRAALTAPNN